MRYLTPFILKDLKKKMVFMGGPRQVGKTTLTKAILKTYQKSKKGGCYFNWDDSEQKQFILTKKWPDQEQLIVFDELHKCRFWKNWIKGVYDTQNERHQFLVTGSARLDVYRRGGDSLLGRYHYWRLHPFTLNELPKGIKAKEAFNRLMRVGGFPEPFLDGGDTAARRWRRERIDRVIRDDVRDLEEVRQINLLQMLVEALQRRVGSPVVIANLAQDLQVHFNTIKQWLEILEKMYLVFIVRPYSKGLAGLLQKPIKVYFFDNADVVGDEGAVFENLVATHLLKTLHFLEDSTGYRYELAYVRDKQGHEVDFAILRDGKLWQLIEAKWSDDKITKSLHYFSERLNPEKSTQIVAQIKQSYSYNKIHVVDSISTLSQDSLFGLSY